MYRVVTKRKRELGRNEDLETFLNELKGAVVAIDFQPETVVVVLLEEKPKK